MTSDDREREHRRESDTNRVVRQKKKITTEEKPGGNAERRRERIRKLEAMLQRERSRFTSEARKERNSQLFAWGAMVEGVCKRGDDGQRKTLEEWAAAFLVEEHHRERARAGFERAALERAQE